LAVIAISASSDPHGECPSWREREVEIAGSNGDLKLMRIHEEMSDLVQLGDRSSYYMATSPRE